MEDEVINEDMAQISMNQDFDGQTHNKAQNRISLFPTRHKDPQNLLPGPKSSTEKFNSRLA